MAPSRRAFLAAVAATMAAARSNQATRSDASASITPTHPVPPTTPTTPGRVGADATDVSGKPAKVVSAGPRTRRQVALTFHLSGDPALILAEAGAAGCPLVVAYDVDPRDYTDPGADAATARLRPGSIVSLHTSHPGTITAPSPPS
jgi:hypothetical protein